jgi:hypothetical protein
MWSGLVQLPSSTREATRTQVRLESCPPAPFGHSSGLLDRLLDRFIDWLGSSAASRRETSSNDATPPPGITPVSDVRLEFADAVADIPTRSADQLAMRIHAARSLRELWHLRADVFNTVSCHCNQAEAHARLSRLNRHFPARAPKSGFGGFDVIAQEETRP